MGQSSLSTSRPISALLLGLVVTALVAAGHVARLDQRLEVLTLDYCFRAQPAGPEAVQIVHVDIDDGSIERIGRWPWPRTVLAGLLETLQQAGARLIAVDVELPEPQEVRYVAEAAELYGGPAERFIGPPLPKLVFDDAAIADVLARHDNIFLPMHIDFSAPEGKGIEAQISRRLQADPEASFQSVLEDLRPKTPDQADPARTEELLRGYLRERSVSALRRLTIPMGDLPGHPLATGRLTPPLVTFAQPLRHTGFVTAEPDSDGVLRRVRLLASDGANAYPQFALAVAAEELARRHGGRYDLSAAPGRVTIRCADGHRRVLPVDENGQMLINWSQRFAVGTAAPSPRHISAAAVLSFWQNAQSIRNNNDLARLLQLSLAQRLGQQDLLELFAQADRLEQQHLQGELARQRALLYEPAAARSQPSDDSAERKARLEERIDQAVAEMLGELDFYLSGLETDDPLAAEIARINGLLNDIAQANEDIRRRQEAQVAELAFVVSGKICLIGSTATAAGDFHVTPLDTARGEGQQPRTPGVVVHANILGTILSGRFIRPAPTWVNLLVILAAGAVISYLTATRRVQIAVPLAVLLGAAYWAFGTFVVFGQWRFDLALVAPGGAILASLLMVTAYRQLTEERAKRHIRGLFAQALSPELVDRLIAEPSLAELGGERRVLSCFFSDLEGFTAISENLGEQETVRLLNRYFDLMSRVIQERHGGYINKFLGDGILALFGAPVPLADHAGRAIRAAVDCQREIERFNEALASSFGAAGSLRCRIGVTTGEAMVGNCGSSQRLDYTAIGDTVNLASRLESANKFFKTRILTDDPTLRQAIQSPDDLLARPLGEVYVVGKDVQIAVWEVYAGPAPAEPETQWAYERFARAVGLYRRRQFAEATELFEAILKANPADHPAEIYLSLCRTHLTTPPPSDWDAALRLTEK